MKKVNAVVLFCVVVTANAQDKLNPVQMPTSPASSIIGVEPTAVLTPKSYQALETALYSNFTDGNGNALIPNDFALEFTPFWASKPAIGLSLKEYLYPSFGAMLWHNSSFSLASTQNYKLGDSSVTNGLGFGYRTSIFLGGDEDVHMTDSLKSQLNSNQSVLVDILAVTKKIRQKQNIATTGQLMLAIQDTVRYFVQQSIDPAKLKKLPLDYVDGVTENICFVDSLPGLDTNNYRLFQTAFERRIKRVLNAKASFEALESYIRQRQGWTVDFACATLLNFPTNTMEFSYLPRFSGWITPTYRFKRKADFLKISAVYRYEWYHLDYFRAYFPASNIYEKNHDWGGALSAEFKKFSIQVEMVGRRSHSEIAVGTPVNGNQPYIKEQSNDFQCIGSFSYNLSDGVSLTYRLGNKFDPIVNPGNTLVSMLMLNFGFGTPTKSENLDLD